MMRPTAALLCLLACSAMAAAEPDAAERQRIAAERQVVETRFQAAQRDCASRFLVNDCMDQARGARRQALEPLQRQSHLLDDARRRARAIDRQKAIELREVAASAARAPQASAMRSPAASAPSVQRAVRVLPAAGAASAAALERAQRLLRYEQIQQQAAARQRASQERNARRDEKKLPAAGLPVPGASAP